jgi:hypothetical protein
MSSASGSFEDFMAGFMERHPNWFGSDSRPVQAVKAPMVKEAVKAQEKAVSVRLAAVPDRMSEAAGDDWDSIEPEEFTEVVE